MHIVIGHMNGSEKRERNLKFTIKYYQHYFPSATILVIEQKTVTNLSEFSGIEYLHLPIKHQYYNRSLGFNEGYRKTDSKLIFFTDNDFLLDPSLVSKIEEYMERYDLFIPYNYCWMLNEEETEEFVANGPDFRPAGGFARTKKNGARGGAMIITRQAYKRIGGHDEDFKGWGGEDDIFFYMAKERVKVGRPEGEFKMMHLHHERGVFSPDSDYQYNRNKVLDYRQWSKAKRLEYNRKIASRLEASPFPMRKKRVLK